MNLDDELINKQCWLKWIQNYYLSKFNCQLVYLHVRFLDHCNHVIASDSIHRNCLGSSLDLWRHHVAWVQLVGDSGLLLIFIFLDSVWLFIFCFGDSWFQTMGTNSKSHYHCIFSLNFTHVWSGALLGPPHFVPPIFDMLPIIRGSRGEHFYLFIYILCIDKFISNQVCFCIMMSCDFFLSGCCITFFAI